MTSQSFFKFLHLYLLGGNDICSIFFTHLGFHQLFIWTFYTILPTVFSKILSTYKNWEYRNDFTTLYYLLSQILMKYVKVSKSQRLFFWNSIVQKTNDIYNEILPQLHRAEFCLIFCSFFGAMEFWLKNINKGALLLASPSIFCQA